MTRFPMVRERCSILAATVTLIAGLVGAAFAQTSTLHVISHPVHERVSTEGQAGNVAGAWSDETGIDFEWSTFSIAPLNERLFRELNLPETDFDVAFLLNTQAVPSVIEKLEPLDPYMADAPIEDFDDFFPGMVDAMTFDGQLYGVPFRSASSGMIYNQALLEERGIDGPPATAEEFMSMVEELTFTRDDGTRVYGFVIPGAHYANIVDVARMWNGDFISPSYEAVAHEDGMVQGVQAIVEMFEAGVLPENWTNVNSEDADNLMQTGRAAITFGSLGDAQSYNTEGRSEYAGSFRAAPLPVAEELQDEFPVGPSKVEFWTMVIPANSSDKDAAWDFIRHLSSPQATLDIALNGNGPTRASTYDDPAFAEAVGYADVAKQVLEVARIPLPAFDASSQAADIFLEEVHLAVLGMKDVADAMQSVTDRVEPLLP